MDDIYNLPELYNLKEDLEPSMVDKSQDHQLRENQKIQEV